MKTRRYLTVVPLPLLAVLWLIWQWTPAPLPSSWSEQELQLIQSLSLFALPPPPADPGNAVADNPDAARLGRSLFFDTRLSADGRVSCATCHQPERMFTDGKTVAEAIARADRNTMGLLGVAYTPWLFWDGRKDSLWSQALEPLENPREHGISRVDMARLLMADPDYNRLYRSVFPDEKNQLPLHSLLDRDQFPDATPLGTAAQQQAWELMSPEDRHSINRIFSNAGKALAAWQRLLQPATSPFDNYADALQADNSVRKPQLLTNDAVAGLRLFLGKAQCINCHNGPLFTNNAFHNTAVLSGAGLLPAAGRSEGLRRALSDEFNCLGPFSDARDDQCAELLFVRSGDELIGAQRTASLRNLAYTAPYMHAGQIATLKAVVDHYNRADVAVVGHNEAKPLGLRAIEKRQLLAFLAALNSNIAADIAKEF
jgi:cytochrome c peroxidase